LLEQKELDAAVRRQFVLPDDSAEPLQSRIVAEREAGGDGNADRDRERQREREDRDHRHRHERRAVAAQVEKLFGDERADAFHRSRWLIRCK
jgi:hypothetical protein